MGSYERQHAESCLPPVRISEDELAHLAEKLNAQRAEAGLPVTGLPLSFHFEDGGDPERLY